MTMAEAFLAVLWAWRRDFSAHPEFGFQERRSAGLVAERLRGFASTDVVEGVGGTGVVATLTQGGSNRAIALRADMDALRFAEQGTAEYRSQASGLMQACGHDGHTTMLLGAAKLLADGLAWRFPFDQIYGLHNSPGMPRGRRAGGKCWWRPAPLW